VKRSHSILVLAAVIPTFFFGCRGPVDDQSKLKLQIDPQLATTDWNAGPRQEAATTEIDRQSQRFADRLFAPNPMPTEMPPNAKDRLAKSVHAMEGAARKGRPAWSEGVAEPPRIQDHDLPKPWPIQVRQGESLRTIARWAVSTTTRILKDNNALLGRRKWLRAGDRLHITMSANQKVTFDKTREQHGQNRLDNYFATRYIAKVVVYRVSRHESVADAARRYGDVPLWLLQEFNKRDFTRLRRGAEILIPVVKRYNKADGLPPVLELVDAGGDVLSSEKKVRVEARMNDDLLGRARLAIDDGSFFERGDRMAYAGSRAVLPTYGKLAPAPPQTRFNTYGQPMAVGTAPALVQGVVVSQAGDAVVPHAAIPREVLVKAGETLGKYAKWSQLSVRSIRKANPGLNPDRIFIGTRIRLPLSDVDWGNFVLARAGRRKAKPVQAFQARPPSVAPQVQAPTVYRPLVAPRAVQDAAVNGFQGQALSAVPEALIEVFYTVRPGDIASKIARKNQVPLATLSALNPTRNLHLLKIGQRLRIR
jgi:LysM repeat protein